jgi:4-nitrophenyl phosphatase
VTSPTTPARLRKVKAWLLDLDGTVWDGQTPAPGATEFIAAMRGAGLPVLFLSNNSWQRPQSIAQRLQRMGIAATEQQILTAGAMTGPVLRQMYGPQRCLVSGSAELQQMLTEAGHRVLAPAEAGGPADAVVIGHNTALTYADLTACCRAVKAGARLVAANLDGCMPVEGGTIVPKPGAVAAAIQAALAMVMDPPEALCIGKPAPHLFRAALERLQLPAAEVAIAGDGLPTDVAGGLASGLPTVWLMRGQDPARRPPDALAAADLGQLLEQLRAQP